MKMIVGLTEKKSEPTFMEVEELAALLHLGTHISLKEILTILSCVFGVILEKNIAIVVDDEEDDDDD
jgi:hypothetical protein